jgi:hypothetical protein
VEIDVERRAGKEIDMKAWKWGVKEDEEACKVDADAVAVEMEGGKDNEDTANGGGPDASDQYARACSPSLSSTSPSMSISVSTSIPISSRFSYAVLGWCWMTTGENHFHRVDDTHALWLLLVLAISFSFSAPGHPPSIHLPFFLLPGVRRQ